MEKSFERLKVHAYGNNKCQQLPTLLCVVGHQCYVRLHGPKSLTGFKLYATSANIVGPNNWVVGCCWPTMLGPFAWALTEQTVERPDNTKDI